MVFVGSLCYLGYKSPYALSSSQVEMKQKTNVKQKWKKKLEQNELCCIVQSDWEKNLLTILIHAMKWKTGVRGMTVMRAHI